MWCKGRENKTGELEDANVKVMAEKLVSSLKLSPLLFYYYNKY